MKKLIGLFKTLALWIVEIVQFLRAAYLILPVLFFPLAQA